MKESRSDSEVRTTWLDWDSASEEVPRQRCGDVGPPAAARPAVVPHGDVGEKKKPSTIQCLE